MSYFSISPKILATVSPSIEVQEQFKSMVKKRILLVAGGVFNALALFVLVAPASMVTFEACVVSVLLYSTIGFVAMLAFTAYQCRFKSYDEDAEVRVQALISDRRYQLPLLTLIKKYPQDLRDGLIKNAQLFFTEETTDLGKSLTIFLLIKVSDEILKELTKDCAKLKQILLIEPYAIPLVLLVNNSFFTASMTNEYFNEERKTMILNSLKIWNEELQEGFNQLKDNYDDLKKSIEAKFEQNKFTGTKYQIQKLLLDNYGKKLGLDDNSPVIQQSRQFEKDVKEALAKGLEKKSSDILREVKEFLATHA